ncbi:hypothetical protein ACLOJK_010696 [Asimina triloba]
MYVSPFHTAAAILTSTCGAVPLVGLPRNISRVPSLNIIPSDQPNSTCLATVFSGTVLDPERGIQTNVHLVGILIFDGREGMLLKNKDPNLTTRHESLHHVEGIEKNKKIKDVKGWMTEARCKENGCPFFFSIGNWMPAAQPCIIITMIIILPGPIHSIEIPPSIERLGFEQACGGFCAWMLSIMEKDESGADGGRCCYRIPADACRVCFGKLCYAASYDT